MADEQKKLYRSADNRWLGGVCGGMGEYFNLDPTIVRVIFILLALAIGGGILIYLVLWLIIPAEPEDGAISAEPAWEEDE